MHLHFLKAQFIRLMHLVQTGAPLWLIVKYFYLHIRDRRSPRRAYYLSQTYEFRRKSKELSLDNDWFSGNIPTWLSAFEKEHLSEESSINILEIGSWQGLSAFFIVDFFPKSTVTCVDTWEGADEQKKLLATSEPVLRNIENVFDKNLRDFSHRIEKYKGTSYSYFNDRFEINKFDLIYIDGSHHCDDVIVDAIKAFEMLKVGGLMIFDDYFWKYYDRKIDNPAGAINSFLRMKRHQLKIICFDYQIVIKKLEGSVR